MTDIESGAIYLIPIIFLLILQASWIFFDARKRGELYWIWGIFGLLNVPSSLLIYLIVTRYRKVVCPDCGRAFRKKEHSCPHCGGGRLTCARCDAEVQFDWTYCPYCAYQLKND